MTFIDWIRDHRPEDEKCYARMLDGTPLTTKTARPDLTVFMTEHIVEDGIKKVIVTLV